MLSENHAFLFIHVPKTGGNSIQKALLPFSEDRLALIRPVHDGVDRFEIRSPRLDIHKHSTLQDYCRQLDPSLFARLTKVTCVRNPWDRCVSFFFSPHRGSVDWSPDVFADFIRSTVHPHAHYLTLEEQTVSPFDNVDFVLRFERLTDDFAILCNRLGLEPLELPRLNIAQRDTYQTYYPDQRLIDLVAARFAPEIERFGYTF